MTEAQVHGRGTDGGVGGEISRLLEVGRRSDGERPLGAQHDSKPRPPLRRLAGAIEHRAELRRARGRTDPSRRRTPGRGAASAASGRRSRSAVRSCTAQGSIDEAAEPVVRARVGRAGAARARPAGRAGRPRSGRRGRRSRRRAARTPAQAADADAEDHPAARQPIERAVAFSPPRAGGGRAARDVGEQADALGARRDEAEGRGGLVVAAAAMGSATSTGMPTCSLQLR